MSVNGRGEALRTTKEGNLLGQRPSSQRELPRLPANGRAIMCINSISTRLGRPKTTTCPFLPICFFLQNSHRPTNNLSLPACVCLAADHAPSHRIPTIPHSPRSHQTNHANMSSYADVAASGPKQTPQEAAAPRAPEIEPSQSVSTGSLVDVDTPSVRTVPSDWDEQDIKTETQAARLEREEEQRRAEEDLAKKRASQARRADSFLAKWFGNLGDGASTALVVSNLVGVIGLSGFLGYKAWDLHERGRLGWKNLGLGLGVMGVVGIAEGVLGRYLYKGKKKSQ